MPDNRQQDVARLVGATLTPAFPRPGDEWIDDVWSDDSGAWYMETERAVYRRARGTDAFAAVATWPAPRDVDQDFTGFARHDDRLYRLRRDSVLEMKGGLVSTLMFPGDVIAGGYDSPRLLGADDGGAWVSVARPTDAAEMWMLLYTGKVEETFSCDGSAIEALVGQPEWKAGGSVGR
jgi:hypothetical protein